MPAGMGPGLCRDCPQECLNATFQATFPCRDDPAAVADRQLAAAFPGKSPELRRAFDDPLLRLKADGSHDKLVDKYHPRIRRYFPDCLAGKR